MKNLILIFVIFLGLSVFAQETYKGKIINENGQGIARVHVWIDGTTIGTITNKKGEYSLPIDAFPVHIHISHLSYISKELILKNEKEFIKPIRLEALIYTLPTASVSDSKVNDLTKSYWYDISDFEIYQDHILLLAYQWKRKQNPWLIMLNAYGDTLWSSYLGRDGELYKDCLGKIHLVNKKAAYQIFIEEDSFQLYPAVSIKDFEEQLKPCIASHETKIYLEQYTYANQVLNYFEADLADTSVHIVASVSDDRSKRWLYDDAMGISPLRNEHEQRFEELFFYDPIYAPLIKQGDTTIIFDFVNDEIGIFNSDFETISVVDIDFHHSLKWKEKLFVDETTQKVYCMFRRGGFHYLHEINLWTGKLSAAIDIPKFTFIGKVRIHDGYAYFLYRDREEDQALTKVYQMRLN